MAPGPFERAGRSRGMQANPLSRGTSQVAMVDAGSVAPCRPAVVDHGGRAWRVRFRASAEVGVKSGRILSKWGQVWANFGRSWSSPGQVWSVWAKCWSILGQIGSIRASLGGFQARVGPMFVKVGRARPRLDQTRSKFGRIRPNLADVGRSCPKVGYLWPQLSQIRPLSARFRPNSARSRQNLRDLGKIGLHSNNLHGPRSGRERPKASDDAQGPTGIAADTPAEVPVELLAHFPELQPKASDVVAHGCAYVEGGWAAREFAANEARVACRRFEAMVDSTVAMPTRRGGPQVDRLVASAAAPKGAAPDEPMALASLRPLCSGVSTWEPPPPKRGTRTSLGEQRMRGGGRSGGAAATGAVIHCTSFGCRILPCPQLPCLGRPINGVGVLAVPGLHRGALPLRSSHDIMWFASNCKLHQGKLKFRERGGWPRPDARGHRSRYLCRSVCDGRSLLGVGLEQLRGMSLHPKIRAAMAAAKTKRMVSRLRCCRLFKAQTPRLLM